MREYIYPEGTDCSWLAMDGRGNVAAFVTAGSGPIPEVLFQNHTMPPEDIESRLAELPVTSSAGTLVKLKIPDFFMALAQRGLYVFDWSDATRTRSASTGRYDFIAWPNEPIRLNGLMPDLQAVAQSAVLPSADFSSRQAIDVRAHLSCFAGRNF